MIRLLLVDDHTIVLDGIKALLSNSEEINIIGDAPDGETLFSLLKNSVPDIIIMDISLPGKSGIDLCREVKQQYPEVMVLFLSMYTSEEFVVNALKAGASGYLPKNISRGELLKAIHTIYKGGDYFSHDISGTILRNFIRKSEVKNEESDPRELLSRRETEILQLAAGGLSNSDIAERLFISIRTVESHKNHIMQKLNLRSPVDLIKFAIKHHITEI
jgi:DNA-binding NarL/FixJ family response regulator